MQEASSHGLVETVASHPARTSIRLPELMRSMEFTLQGRIEL